MTTIGTNQTLFQKLFSDARRKESDHIVANKYQTMMGMTSNTGIPGTRAWRERYSQLLHARIYT